MEGAPRVGEWVMHTGFGVGTRKRSLERPRRRGENNIKVDFNVIGLDGTRLVLSMKTRQQTSCSMQCGGILDRTRTC